VGDFRCLLATFWASKKAIVNWVSHLIRTMHELVEAAQSSMNS
jgi:hypothetical protein